MRRVRALAPLVTFVVMHALCAGRVCGQAPTIDTSGPPPAGSTSSALGPAPGSGGGGGGAAGGGAPYLGGAPGVISPRVPTTITVPGSTDITPPPIGMSRTVTIAPVAMPAYGSLSLPTSPESLGPPNGLTLDQAIDRLLAANLDLRSKYYEIPQAESDVLTASLRANPVFYADSQLQPYQAYSRERPGGPGQYDVNVSIPLDVNNKRGKRMISAEHAKDVVIYQYQDAVRLEIDNLYTAFVDVLAARETLRYADSSVAGLEQILVPIQERYEKKVIALTDVNQVKIQLEFSKIGRDGADETMRKTLQTLAGLLNYTPAQAERLDIRGALRDTYPQPPRGDALVQIAFASRPDLLAYRVGVMRAEADVKLAQANRYADIYWLVQPYTFQDMTYMGVKSATSWATGVTVPLPICNRNQGVIERARLNVTQTQIEMAALQRAIVTEVNAAEKDYNVTRSAVQRVEKDLLPAAYQVLDTVRLKQEKGQVSVVEYLSARRDYNDVVRQYRDLLVQHRRSMLKLNTVVGRRLLP